MCRVGEYLEESGTGGTPLASFLKTVRAHVEEARIQQ